MPTAAIVMAGIPEINATLYHRIRFSVGDPVAYIWLQEEAGSAKSVLILRDIEMQRARRQARADRVACPADYAPSAGLSGDRETATAQAAAECLRRARVACVTADRSLPLIFAEIIRQAGIAVQCDMELGVSERRQKDGQEIAWLRQAQKVTEQAVAMACRLIATARADSQGCLVGDGGPLSSESVRAAIDRWLLDRGFSGPPAIVAGGPAAADCHDIGSGPLRTEQPIIIDIFPRDRATHYYGDCTRSVVHGRVSEVIARMHAAVVQAKAAGAAAIRAGVTGEAVHQATAQAMARSGYPMGLPESECLTIIVP